MPLVTPFAWRCASRGSFPEGLWKGSAMPKAGGVTQRLQGVCFKGSCRAVEATATAASVTMAKGPRPPCTLPRFPRDQLLCLPSPGDNSQPSPSPHSGHFPVPLLSLVLATQPPPSPRPVLPSPVTTASAPLPSYWGLCSTPVPPDPWATSPPSRTKICGPQGNTSGVARPRH